MFASLTINWSKKWPLSQVCTHISLCLSMFKVEIGVGRTLLLLFFLNFLLSLALRMTLPEKLRRYEDDNCFFFFFAPPPLFIDHWFVYHVCLLFSWQWYIARTSRHYFSRRSLDESIVFVLIIPCLPISNSSFVKDIRTPVTMNIRWRASNRSSYTYLHEILPFLLCIS